MTRTLPPNNKGKTFAPEPLTAAEVRALVGAASARSTSGVRLRALVATLYGSGIRLGECLTLLPRDVDLDASTVRIRRGKGSRWRLAGIDGYAAGFLAAWLERRATFGINGRQPVFCCYEVGKEGQPLSPRYVRKALVRVAERAGVEKRVTAHQLRHSHAFSLANDGVPVHVISRQLGHSNSAVTARYIDHLRPGDVIEIVRQRDWGV